MFKYRFQKPLEIKEEEENIIKNELNKLNSDLKNLENEFLQIEDKIRLLIITYEKNSTGILNINSLNRYNSYLGIIKQEKMLKNLEIEQKQKEIDDKKDEYIEIRREKLVFEKLKEKYYERYREEELRKEQKEYDEISNNLYFRRT